MYWGRPVKIDTALYPISTQRNLAVAPDDISMPLNPDFYGRAFQLNSCWKQYEACAYLRLPSVCIAKRTCIRQIFPKMVTSCSPWAQSWTKPNACKECLPGSQPNYRLCLTSIPLSFQQLFRDNTSRWTRCFRHHLMATASGIGSRDYDTF